MALELVDLLEVERLLLLQDRLADADLADVVQQGRLADRGDPLLGMSKLWASATAYAATRSEWPAVQRFFESTALARAGALTAGCVGGCLLALLRRESVAAVGRVDRWSGRGRSALPQ